ncbi:MAG: ABC transporter substrate-binding protein [Halalkalicoccus sp.]
MNTSDSGGGISRRDVLRTTGTGLALGTTGLAGCLGSDEIEELTVAYMPIYPDMQQFVMQEEGYFEEFSVPVDAREFSDGPSIVQAYASGEIDVGLFGIVPSMIVIDRGIEAKVVAANIKEPMMIMADERLRELWDDHGPEAFARYEEETGRTFRFGTFPEGSVPDILLRYWLSDVHDLTPGEDVEITEIGGANAVWQAMANEEIDGTSIMEPVPTIAKEEGSPIDTLAIASEFMPGQPAAVALMSDAVRDHEVGEEFLAAHVRATEFIDEEPDRTAEHASTVIGASSLPVERARAALDSPLSNFVSDPREIESGTEIFAEYAHELGRTDERLSLEEIFDYDLYESVR